MVRHSRRRRAASCLIVFALLLGARQIRAASDHYGQVTTGGVPVPGATVTATHGDRQVVTVTDQRGVYRLPELADGVWTAEINAGQGLRPVPATFTATR